MQHSLRSSIAIAIAITILAGCNATTSPNGTTTTPGSMTATVNGKAWSSAVVPGITGGATATVHSGIYTVTGVASDATEITLVLANPQVGSDSLGALTSTDFAEYSQGIPDTSTAYISIPGSFLKLSAGSVTITQFDTVHHQISGTFDFVGRKAHNLSDTTTVNAGSFYQVGW